ncbi:MAG: HD family phosphohydrolase [Deltaproteobacteria bacterium CG03_land_8_20_14_0_80_45_14]|nr:MAG: HD family phosphohydrolase [Deltaproteobacteria bacterium CG03_land_8_20_14_0_80_45_14]
MKTYTNEIKENDSVESFFLVEEKSSGITKTGNAYLKLKLVDRSGEIEGRIWTLVENYAKSFGKDDFVHVMGKAVSFQEHLQLNITHIERVGEEEILFSDFFPMAEKNIDEMFRSLLEITQQIKNPHLSQLLQLFWEDESFIKLFKMAPASKWLHHNYLGGLLEHTLSIVQLVLKNASHYNGLNLDLLLTASILHDLGKVDELSYQRSFAYSDEGRLLGHILLGIERVEDKIRQLTDFPKDLSTLLKHLLLSHHGQYIWGSPKRPMTLEAVMLHYLDDMDAKINGIKQFIKKQVPKGSRWSAYHRIFEQYFYVSNLLEKMELPDKIEKDELEEE